MHDNHHPHPGLLSDLEHMAELERRRRALRLLAGFSAVASLPLVGLGAGAAPTRGGRPAPSPTPSPSPSPSPSSCSTIPSETAGPYPGDGTNTANGSVANVLMQSGVVRSDIRSSFGSFAGTAAGVPLVLTLKLVNTASVCTTLNGYAVYLWHCDRDGNYSMYNLPAQNYLRGVQVSDSLGQVTFTTIFPGCYSGRYPHMHFEIYPSLSLATSGANDIKTSQLALPAAACSEVYAGASGYATSATNFKRTSLATDGIFSDGATLQTATVSSSVANGYTATLTVGVSA